MAADDERALDTAWRIHAAIVDWTGKVDSKASFALAIQSAVIIAVIGFAGGRRRLSHLDDPAEQAAFWIGITMLTIALVLVTWVVRPRLRTKAMKNEWPDNFIYFGHLRYWDPDALEAALKDRPILPLLTRQVVSMSQIAWQKHKCLQWSMVLAAVGAGAVALAALFVG